MATLLEIKNVETFYRLIYALRGVSLSVEEGTITAILGNNGAGKSSVLPWSWALCANLRLVGRVQSVRR